MTFAAMSLLDATPLLSDSASPATESAPALLAASTAASATTVAASAETDAGTDSSATGSSSSGGYGPGAKAESAAALVELNGASSLTVNDYLISVPPNMAAATALMNELSTSGNISYAAASSVYTLLDSGATLALTSD